MSLQSREQVKPRRSHQTWDELQGFPAPQGIIRARLPGQHHRATQPLGAASKNWAVTPSPVIPLVFRKIPGENKPVLQPSEDSRVSSVLDYKALPSSSCFHPENLLINPLPC